jgi:hypothetical protein
VVVEVAEQGQLAQEVLAVVVLKVKINLRLAILSATQEQQATLLLQLHHKETQGVMGSLTA